MFDVLSMLMDLGRQHLPQGYVGATYLLLGLGVIAALIMLSKGARLVPFISAVAFLGGGVSVGAGVAQHFGWTPWPSIVVLGAVGVALGALLHRFWLAVVLGGCFAVAALGVYSANVVAPHYDDFVQGASLNEDPVYSLPDAAGDAPDPAAAAGEFVNYLSQQVPHMRLILAVVALSAGLAGLVFGLLLPTLSRALVAATAGTLTLLFTLTGLLHLAGKAHWTEHASSWGWIVVACLWSGSLLFNLLDERRRNAPTKIYVKQPDGDDAANPATA